MSIRSEPDSSHALEGGGDSALPNTGTAAIDDFLPSNTPVRETRTNDGEWILAAQQCYRTSTDFFDGNLRRNIEESMDLARSRHPEGSKYHLPSFAKRSRLFRPKTRAALRKKEAAVVKAFFATEDIIGATAVNETDKLQIKAARVKQEVLNYRLTKTADWFQAVIGAWQDAERQGFVVARTDWDYRLGKRYFTDGTSEEFVQRDTPTVTIIPGENLRVDPSCNWMNPIETSPYVIEVMPMRLHEIREMQKRDTRLKFRDLSDSELKSGLRNDWDSIRTKREGARQDRYDRRTGFSSYDTIWVHRNIIRIDGDDYLFLTVGTEIMLTDPVPLSEVDPRGYRGYTWGYTVLESHNPFPDGEVQMMKNIQEEINEVANMRADGMKLATIGRYFASRGANVDTAALVRSVPGSVVEMDDINAVRWDKAPTDSTRSAFEEQDRLNAEMDDLVGVFNGGSVETNRRMSETVGGMELLSDNANEITEYSVRTFSETWVKPTLVQMMDLISAWETDETIAAIVGQKHGMEVRDVFKALNTPVSIQVNVGFGNTNPQARLRRLQMGFGLVSGMFPQLMQQADPIEAVQEIFGALGYQSAERFFPTLAGEKEEARMQQLRSENEQLKQMLEGKQLEYQSRERIAQMQSETKVRVEEMKHAGNERMMQLKRELDVLIEKGRSELKVMDLQIRIEGNEMKKNELYMQREALSHTIQMAEREFGLKVEQLHKADVVDEVPEEPVGVSSLIQRLRSPASGAPDDKSGVIARGNYGTIPFKEG